MLVSIDVEACREVVRRVRASAGDITQAWSEVEEAARAAGTTARSLRSLGEHLEEAEVLAKELETRVELALLCNTGGVSLASGHRVLTYQVGADTLADVKAGIGARIADRLGDLDPDTGDTPGADVRELEELTALLERYGDDPDVMARLFTGLGAGGVVDAPVVLRRLAEVCAQGGFVWPDTDAGGDGVLVADPQEGGSERLAGLQQRFLEAFGAGLGVATRSGTFRDANPGFAADLVEVGAQSQDGRGGACRRSCGSGTTSRGS